MIERTDQTDQTRLTSNVRIYKSKRNIQLFRSRPPPRPPRLTPPTLPCQPPRADQAGADRGEEFWCLEFWSDPWVAQYQTIDNEL